MLTRNIAKSGKVQVWSGISPFHTYLILIQYRPQTARAHSLGRWQQSNEDRKHTENLTRK